MKKHSIRRSTLTFLKDLAKNNDRNWFNDHKTLYLDAYQNMCAVADDLIAAMNKHDDIETTSGKQSLYRIYKDVRFSKDKSPYNPRFAFGLRRATKLRRGGYYVHIKPGNSFVGCGFFSPSPEDLKRIRADIDLNYDQWRKLLRTKGIKENFGEIQGEKVATAPKGYPKDHPAIDLLRQKQFIFRHHFSDAEVMSDNFISEVNRIFKSIRPYFDLMSEVLTTDVNGESIL